MLNRSRSYYSWLTFGWVKRFLSGYWNRGWLQKTVVVTLSLGAFWFGIMYGLAQIYIYSHRNQPLIIGTSFIPAYAESLGVDPQQTMDSLINEVGVRHFRLVSYWDQLEPTKGNYDFSLLDWQFKKAEAAGAKITLSLGLRQPRWPECHMPSWASSEPQAMWEAQLSDYIGAVVQRYKNSPALDSYQVENEYFLTGFGICETIPGGMDRERLVDEFNLVHRLDPKHKIIINRSNNAVGWPVGAPTPDVFGISIYKRVWDAHLTHRYVEYPFPAWYYGFLAEWQKIFTGRDMIIHELQAEAYAPNYKSVQEVSLEEQNKSFNAERFRGRIEYGKGTGMREMYLWGGEYWYYRKIKLHDPTVWNTAKDIFKQNQK